MVENYTEGISMVSNMYGSVAIFIGIVIFLLLLTLLLKVLFDNG